MSFINEPSSPPPLICYVVVAAGPAPCTSPHQQDDDKIDEIYSSYEAQTHQTLSPTRIHTSSPFPLVIPSSRGASNNEVVGELRALHYPHVDEDLLEPPDLF
jgi:hypothetical protein